MAVKRFAVGPRMSGAVVNGNTVYLAGLTADDTSQDVKGQTAQILAKIDNLLRQAGTDKSRVLSANIWLTDIGTWSQMNEVWDKWVSPGNTPARATVEAKLAAPGLNVEIMVQAALPEGRAAAASRPAARKAAKKATKKVAKKKAAKKKT
jgi:enamine deaminase RidA (YjgF/YER057c/UK114 family)